jgi:hypothetical protein
MNWDVAIVGAGPAGLFIGCQILRAGQSNGLSSKAGVSLQMEGTRPRAHPTLRVLLLERYNYVGGRLYTYHKRLANRDVQWEMGAGRIAKSHRRVHALLDKYGLHTTPLDPRPDLWIDDGGKHTLSYLSLFPVFLREFASLSPAVLATNTLADLFRKTGNAAALPLFPYWSEVHVQRADLALKFFLEEEFSRKEQFSGITEGFTALAKAMAAEFVRLGGVLQLGATVLDARSEETKRGESVCQLRVLHDGIRSDILAKTCVLATHAMALRSMPSVRRRMPVLRHLQMEPLVRMYAVFPVTDGKTWFSGLPRMVTAGRVRYIIPIREQKGIIMISYTDGPDARYWIEAQRRHGNDWVAREVLRDVRALLPDRRIPDPYAFKIHPWHAGCTYWRPGTYDVEKAATEDLHVGGGLFACGESLALRQAWMEGALESAETLLALPAFSSRLNE